MPKFSITTDNSNGPEHTEEPLEFPDAKAAIDGAQIALADMARDTLPDGKHADFAVIVKDDAGNEIYRASLSFAAKGQEDIQREDEEFEAAVDELAATIKGRPRE